MPLNGVSILVLPKGTKGHFGPKVSIPIGNVVILLGQKGKGGHFVLRV